MQFRTVFPIGDPGFRIDHSMAGLLVGSCFSDNIGRILSRYCFPVGINPFGTVYNPKTIVDTLKLLRSGEPIDPDSLRKRGEIWFSFTHNSIFTSCDKELLINKINGSIKDGSELLGKADYLILTLGTSWVYEDLESGKVVANCHKMPASRFKRYRMTVEEVVDEFSSLLSDPFFSSKKVVFTVSPVRHFKDGAVENQLSKATLLIAVDVLKERFNQVSYFPSYEIVMDDLRDYRFYAPDMIHLSETAIDYLWERFSEAFMETGVREANRRIEGIRKSLEHRPANPDSEEHQRFLQRVKEKVKELNRSFPNVKFKETTI